MSHLVAGLEDQMRSKIRMHAYIVVFFDVFILFGLSIIFSSGYFICNQQPAEDLVLVINSVTQPTLFFPGSNRILNVVGFLSSGIKDVVLNYHFQIFARMFLAITWPYIIFSTFMSIRTRLLATLLFHAIVLFQFDAAAINIIYGSVNPYSSSLFFLALSFVFSGKYLEYKGGSIYIVLTFIFALLGSSIAQTNTVYVILAASFYLAFHYSMYTPYDINKTVNHKSRLLDHISLLIAKHRRSILVAFAYASTIILASLAAALYSLITPDSAKSFSTASYTAASISFDGIFSAAANILNSSSEYIFSLEFVIIIAAAIYLYSYGNFRKANAYVAVLISGLAYVAILSQLHHIELNGYNVRYYIVFPLFMIIIVSKIALSVTGALVGAFTSRHSAPFRLKHGIISAVSVAVCLIAIILGFERFGLPTGQCDFGTQAAEDQQPNDYRQTGQMAVAEGYFAILGSYWDVWPTVFHAWAAAGQTPTENKVFPTGYRAEILAPTIKKMAIQKLMRGEDLNFLCVGNNKKNTEFGTIDCNALISWNKGWGVLPTLGSVTTKELSNNRVRVSLSVPKLSVGDRIDFSAAGNPGSLLTGWSPPEGFGTWTNGLVSQLAFKLACEKPSDIGLELELASWIGAFTSNPKPLNVQMLWNGVSVSHWGYSKGFAEMKQKTVVPGDAIHCNSTNIVEFHIDGPVTPRSIGVGPDDRLLGIAFKSLSLSAL